MYNYLDTVWNPRLKLKQNTNSDIYQESKPGG